MEFPNAQFLNQLIKNHSPAGNKLSWEKLCSQVSSNVPPPPQPSHLLNGIDYTDDLRGIDDTNYVIDDGGDDLCMSNQLLARLSYSSAIYTHIPQLNKSLVSVLRHEDAIHIPLLQIDNTTGVIIDWNRAMTDLTGLSRSAVTGKTYADILTEWAPALSEEYRAAAVDWISKEKDERIAGDYWDRINNERRVRGHYMFPLPLPIKNNFDSNNGGECWYIELLACRAETALTECYTCHFFAEWKMPTKKGWIGGAEFTLRKKQVLPSPRSVAGPIDGDGTSRMFNDAVSEKPAPSDAINKDAGNASRDADVYDAIINYSRSSSPVGIGYLREVLYHVRMAMRKPIVNPKKAHSFTKDWATHADTAEMNKVVMKALGGARIFEQSVTGGKMVWRLAFTTSYSKKNGMDERFELESKRREWERRWNAFVKKIAPVVGESKHSRSICAATDAPNIIPGIDNPDRTLLTLKIEGIERNAGSYQEEKFKASATVQVPATLNFFQLHRVINQTMHCSSQCTRETHVWKVKNIAPENDSSDDFHHVQLGETYWVENGKKAHSNEDHSLFGKGAALRQRVSKTAAHYDQFVPFYHDRYSTRRGYECHSVSKIYACIHSTCISAAFYQPGASAILENGMVKYCTKYKISCTRIDEYTGSMPENSNINVMLPKCLRGKNEDQYLSACNIWSVDRANAQLEKDRGCLRRNLCPTGTKGGMQVMPWCWSGDFSLGTNTPSVPLAAQLRGTDLRPMCLFGEPPLPGSLEYTKYITTIDGRIDPDFLQEHVVDSFSFAVPFKRLERTCGYQSWDEAPTSSVNNKPCLGEIWQTEVDEEMERIESLQPKKRAKSKGKKRKLDPTSCKA